MGSQLSFYLGGPVLTDLVQFDVVDDGTVFIYNLYFEISGDVTIGGRYNPAGENNRGLEMERNLETVSEPSVNSCNWAEPEQGITFSLQPYSVIQL